MLVHELAHYSRIGLVEVFLFQVREEDAFFLAMVRPIRVGLYEIHDGIDEDGIVVFGVIAAAFLSARASIFSMRRCSIISGPRGFIGFLLSTRVLGPRIRAVVGIIRLRCRPAKRNFAAKGRRIAAERVKACQ